MIDTLAVKSKIDLRELAERFTELRRESASESSGPCPKCAGRDRFHVKREAFFCRHCHSDWGDPFEFMMWLHGVDFKQAAAMLEPGAVLPEVKRAPALAKQAKPAKRRPWDAEQKAALLASQQERLFESERGEPGREYLLGRGLEPESWLAYGLGFNPDALGRGPAISLPWFHRGELVAIRYRLLGPLGDQKLISEPGSRFSGLLFGGQALPEFVTMPLDPGKPPAEASRTLVLIEGEFNCLACWQIAHECAVDVLSVGSESQRLPESLVRVAERYGQVLTWFDKDLLAKRAARALPGAYAVSLESTSLAGQDANDLLQAGQLGHALSLWRLSACKSQADKERLYYDLLDAVSNWQGADAGIGKILQRLAGELGRSVQFAERTDSKVWVNRRLQRFAEGLAGELAKREAELL